MRWGVLINLALVFAVSGLLLLIVFTAALQRSMIDNAFQDALIMADAMSRKLPGTESPSGLWSEIREITRFGKKRTILLYDRTGESIGPPDVKINLPPPDPDGRGVSIRIVDGSFPANIVKGAVLVVDVTGDFPEGIQSARGLLSVPSPLQSSAWRFFVAYLVLTQVSLFFLGSILFHRTVIGPLTEITRIASRAAGLADSGERGPDFPVRGDIQTIAGSLRAMIAKIVNDRRKMEDLVEELRRSNKDLEAAHQGLVRSEKLAGVGRLAAGLAHEIGNPLQIVMGYVELLQRSPRTEGNPDVLKRMEKEVERIHHIIEELLAFARPARQRVEHFDVRDLFVDCEHLFKGRKGFRKLEFRQRVEDDVPSILSEPDKIRQILVNLIFNAADAVSKTGGTVELTASAHEDGIEIAVTDDGEGIRREDLDNVFDPFFTTKEPGKGTGLGLTVCLGLVESLGGSIDIESEEARGTTVIVRLPKRAPAAVETRADGSVG